MTTEEKIIEITQEFIDKNTFIDQTELVENMFTSSDELLRYVDNPVEHKLDTWYLIDHKLAKQLANEGEAILEYDDKVWCGLIDSNPCLNLALQEIATKENV